MLLIGDAIVRLSMRAAEALVHPELGTTHLVFVALWAPAMIYVEGVRAFQRGFAPRAAARALALARAGHDSPNVVVDRPVLRLAAPLVCAGLLCATRRRRIASWGVVTGVVCLVVLITWLPQPWRGLVDLGVVLALSWGVVCMGVELTRILRGHNPTISADFPDAGATEVETA